MKLSEAQLGDVVQLDDGVGTVVAITPRDVIVGYTGKSGLAWSADEVKIPLSTKTSPKISSCKWFKQVSPNETFTWPQTLVGTLKDAWLGDRVSFANRKNNKYDPVHAMNATIIGKSAGIEGFKSRWLLGWKKDEPSPFSPLCATAKDDVVSPAQVSFNHKEYTKVLWVDEDIQGINLTRPNLNATASQEPAKTKKFIPLSEAKIGDRVRLHHTAAMLAGEGQHYSHGKIFGIAENEEATVIATHSPLNNESETMLLGWLEDEQPISTNFNNTFAKAYGNHHPRISDYTRAVGVSGSKIECEVLFSVKAVQQLKLSPFMTYEELVAATQHVAKSDTTISVAKVPDTVAEVEVPKREENVESMVPALLMAGGALLGSLIGAFGEASKTTTRVADDTSSNEQSDNTTTEEGATL